VYDVVRRTSVSVADTNSSTPTTNRHDRPSAMSSEVEEDGIDLFQEPAGYYEPEKQATFASHRLLSGQELTVRLVGHNPLWVSDSMSPS
jgi:hypothetical protein